MRRTFLFLCSAGDVNDPWPCERTLMNHQSAENIWLPLLKKDFRRYCFATKYLYLHWSVFIFQSLKREREGEEINSALIIPLEKCALRFVIRSLFFVTVDSFPLDFSYIFSRGKADICTHGTDSAKSRC